MDSFVTLLTRTGPAECAKRLNVFLGRPGASRGVPGGPPGGSRGLGKGLRRLSVGLPRPSGPSWGPSLEHGFSRGGFGGLMEADLAPPGDHFGVHFGPHFGRFSA